jgi:hypothetical protein
MVRGVKRSAVAVVGVFAIFGVVGPASAAATTMCVPTFGPACPNSGGNKTVFDVEEAMSLDGSDGKADQILIAAGTFTENALFEPSSGSTETYEPTGSDPLTISGAGPGATRLTSAGTKNVFLFDLAHNANSRQITVRDLTARIPASFPDNEGAGFQLSGDTLENVDIVSLNKGSDGVASAVGPGNVFRGGEVRGESGGSIGNGLGSDSAGSLLVENSTVLGGIWGLEAQESGAQLTARRVKLLGALFGAVVLGGSLTLENSVLATSGHAFYVDAAGFESLLNADQITAVDSAGTFPAITVEKSGGAGNAAVFVNNSILRGFASGYKMTTPIGPGIGSASIAVRYSNFLATGTNANGALAIGNGNIDADPLLFEFMPVAGSPSIDAGDPGPGGLANDFLGAPRPVDGDGDGIARPDQGAFEYQPPGPRIEKPGSDTLSPQTTIGAGPGKKLGKGIAKFSFSSSEAGSSFVCKLDRGRAKPCRSPRRYRDLRPGRLLFKVWATDAAGNKDPTPAKRRFRVPAA